MASKDKASEKLSILIADDDPLVRAAVGALVSSQKDMTLAGEAGDGDEALKQVEALRPSILLLDLKMPKKAGLDALRELGDKIEGMQTIVLTLAIDDRQIVEALQLGAKGIVLKESAQKILPQAIRAVDSGKYWVNNEAIASVDSIVKKLTTSWPSHKGTTRDQLSDRDMQIVRLIVEGCTNKDIAKQMGTSEQVVKNHLGKIFDRLGVFNRLELALYALDNQMVERKD